MNQNGKNNFRPISLLSLTWKIFEKVFYQEIENFTNKILSPKLCKFRKGHSSQHALLTLLKNLQKCLDKSGVAGTVLMDFIKAYDCLHHGLHLEKLSAYSFDESCRLVLTANFLLNRYHHVKIVSYLKILRRVPQGSILGPVLFNLFINDLMVFIQESKVCNFADETTIHSCSLNFEEAILKLSNDTYFILNWFRINSLVANPDKFPITFLGSNIDNRKLTFMIENKRVKSRSEVKLLDTTIEDKLSFTTHIENLCNTAGNHLQASARTRKFLSFQLGKRL